MIGRMVARYRIVAELGRGGMGVVWRAEDTLLGRTIALKILPESLASSEEARHRFLREARSASVLDHPGIATVYDTGDVDGQIYIAMRCVEGETIADRVRRGALPIHEAVHIATGAAEALQHAHEHGVLHRDVTARNIMVTRQGQAVVLDFGLARGLDASRLTTTGAAMGTAAYVAPEAVQGADIDHRADVYGLGVVLYEMVTGRTPFRGERADAVIYAAVHTVPEPPSRVRVEVSPDLERIILCALEKLPENRFASARALAAALRAFERGEAIPSDNALTEAETIPLPRPRPARRSRLRPRRNLMLGLTALALAAIAGATLPRLFRSGPQFASVAILPFQNESENPEDSAYLVDGLGQALATKLTQVSGLHVLPWFTSQQYRGSDDPLPKIAAELSVDALLIGSVRSHGDRIQGNIALVDRDKGMQHWAMDFDEPIADLMAVERDVALAAARRLRGRLEGKDEKILARDPSQSVEAYQLYLRGAQVLASGDPAELNIAVANFEKALELDPKLVEAHVGRGAAHARGYYLGLADISTGLRIAEESYDQAIALDSANITARRGKLRAAYERDRSEECLRQAFECARIAPHKIEALQGQGEGYLMGGLADEAVPVLDRAMVLDPSNEGVQWFRVTALCWVGRFEDCIEAEEAFENRFGEDADMHFYAGVSHHELGHVEDAKRHYDLSIELAGENPTDWTYAYPGILMLQENRLDEAQTYFSRGIAVVESRLLAYPDNLRWRVTLANYFAGLGDRAGYERESSAVLNVAVKHGIFAAHLTLAPALLGDSPGALALLKRLGDDGFYNIFFLSTPRSRGLEKVFREPGFDEVKARWEANGARLRQLYGAAAVERARSGNDATPGVP